MAEKTTKKKLKFDNLAFPSSSSSSEEDICIKFKKDRFKAASTVIDFKFNKKRVKVLSKVEEVASKTNGVVYWMSRDARVQDNWAMLFAQKLALKNKVALHVCFCLVPKFLDATIRHFKFLLDGLREVESELKTLDIQFHLLRGEGAAVLPEFLKQHSIGAVVCDFSPLRTPRSWTESLLKNLPADIPLCQVDSHNIVPVWEASNKLEYAARTIRGKITKQLTEYLTHFPPVIKHPYPAKTKAEPVDWGEAESSLEVDRSVSEVDWCKPGTRSGIEVLQSFISKRLRLYGTKRNDPTVNAMSNLSPWFHFGQISVQRCILEVKEHRSKFAESVDSFVEEAVIRRELSDNFCFYNPNYDNLNGANDWARKTLNDHKKDKRSYVYSRTQFEEARTHDDLWNAAQIQLKKEGKMHGFLRMYWAKKILEWTDSPETALSDAIYLNDRYSLDGRDPNGYVGCMWSICGIHDQGWAERAIFGKIRYMTYDGCKRKFDVGAFVARYGGKKHKYEEKK